MKYKLFIGTALRILFFGIIGIIIILLCGLVSVMFTDSFGILMLSMLLGLVIDVAILSYIYPVVFKAFKAYYDGAKK